MEQNNSQQNKNSNKTGKRVEIFFIVSMLIYLTVSIPLLCMVNAFTVHWFIFGLAFILIPFGVLNFFAWGASKTQLTSDQMTLATKRICILTGYLWLLDAFYMCIFNNWIVAIWCVGTTIVIINSIGLINNFLGKVIILKKFIPFDLIITIGIGIYLIYIIPNAQLQQIITTVVSAFFGGALTLVGVAWTIRRQDEVRKQDSEQREKERKEEEKQKAKPIFTFNMLYEAEFAVNGKKVLMDDILGGFDCELVGMIENSDHSVFSIERVFHDDHWFDLNGNKVVLTGSHVYLSIKFNSFKEIIIEVMDSLNNKYYYQIFVVISPKNNGNIPFVHTIRDIKELSEEEILNKK